MIPVNDPKSERESDVKKIKDSSHPRKVIVAGPGTGKSYLFSEIIKKKRLEGKSNFLAITFIGKLGDGLADDLCGLARTTTMHSFARELFLKYHPKWNYFPGMSELISDDLKREGINTFKIGDENYVKKSNYYKSIGDNDVVYYAAQLCKKDKSIIPIFDLVLVDEYQDFNAVESEFVDLLAEKNEVVIVGDDDQALYEFKGSSPSFIREKHRSDNTNFESHTLRFCSRCTEVTIKYFHKIVDVFNLNDADKHRIQKEYICYTPEKENDSKANPKIHLIKNSPVGMIAYKIQQELTGIIKTQKVKDVLIIGEGKSCVALLGQVAGQLKNYGFKNVDFGGNKGLLQMDQDVLDAYKFLSKNDQSLLGWRILDNPTDAVMEEKHLRNTRVLNSILTKGPKELKTIKDDLIEDLEGSIESMPISDRDFRKNYLFRQLKLANNYLPRPLCNLNISVCNILNSKGLGADIVFVVGFDQGKFPAKGTATDNEIYQMLVAITRAKKRIYLINTVGKEVSIFSQCLTQEMVEEEIIDIN